MRNRVIKFFIELTFDFLIITTIYSNTHILDIHLNVMIIIFIHVGLVQGIYHLEYEVLT